MPKYKIRFLPDAAIDRDEIKTYLEQYNGSTFKKFFALLREKTTLLKDFPYSCPVYEDDAYYRKLIVGDYVVFYRVDEESNAIERHRILHGSRNMKRHLRAELEDE
jgi:addiction module RelE/StbE family toxin